MQLRAAAAVVAPARGGRASCSWTRRPPSGPAPPAQPRVPPRACPWPDAGCCCRLFSYAATLPAGRPVFNHTLPTPPTPTPILPQYVATLKGLLATLSAAAGEEGNLRCELTPVLASQPSCHRSSHPSPFCRASLQIPPCINPTRHPSSSNALPAPAPFLSESLAALLLSDCSAAPRPMTPWARGWTP